MQLRDLYSEAEVTRFMQYEKTILALYDQLAALRAELDAAKAANATLKAERDATCEWDESPGGEYWDTACRATWCFEDGGVKENGVTFCHNCGKRVVAVPWVDEPEPDEAESPAPDTNRDAGDESGA